MAYAHPQWKGFERAPEGHLLDQVIDLSGPMGLAYERSVGFRKDFHAHDRPMILLPRGACVVRVRLTGGARTETHTIDSAVAFIVPARVEHEDEAQSSIFDALALFPSPALVNAVAEDEGIPRAVTKLINRAQAIRRGPWLEQLAQEYVFARVISRRESAKTLAFFERQLLVEILISALRRGRMAEPASRASDTVAGRAVRYIEANLFSDLSLDAIAGQAFASPSTLLRHFRRDLGRSPYAYIKARRLEEARRLLEAGMHPVGDIALLVGYENLAAFTTAFSRHFGSPPSSFRKRARTSRS